ncbi:hypothetical protein DOTSEDRAFT_75542 [Dothistroma septosporum NZE10]|uniref:Thioesterase domain-containing protein n=1 Tax=Dothistroma septosporum (strain NZE10 / CBS 128990) TaxID=675120 RepID=M2YIY8_DOTSN|nr:hypothetical protein DOTSEDRAFT_75542 [Dothistroma septosporum NZE10]
MTASHEDHLHQHFGAECKNHPDFQLPWVQSILNDPNVEIIDEMAPNIDSSEVSRSMFFVTLAHPTGLRSRIPVRRPCSEADSSSGQEYVFILSAGNGLDGKSGRAHGGLSSLLLDHMTGMAASHECPQGGDPPATAFLNVDYKNPISTPSVFLARSWVTEVSGRKIFVKGVLEEGSGKVLATGKALFIKARPQTKAAL